MPFILTIIPTVIHEQPTQLPSIVTFNQTNNYQNTDNQNHQSPQRNTIQCFLASNQHTNPHPLTLNTMKIVNITITNEIYKIFHDFQQLVLFAYIHTNTTITTPHDLIIYHNYLATNVIEITMYNTTIYNSIHSESSTTI